MHVIPQSWSHLHILISVFPSVGLLLVLGVYLAGLRTNNDFVRRTCLFVFAMVGLLSIPILVSGLLSMGDLSANPRFAKDAVNTHLIWGMVALGVLLISGAVAGFELWRSWRARRPSGDPFHLVLGLALVALVMTVVAAELGLEINHHELELVAAIPDISTPQAWSHAHIILNHIPTAGFAFAFFFFVTALVANNDLVKQFAAGHDRAAKPCTYCNKCAIHAISDPLGCYELSRYDGDYDRMIKEIMTVFTPA